MSLANLYSYITN